MALSRSERLEPTGAALETLPLSPEDFFVFSRVDGSATVGEVIAASGLDGAAAEKILARLLELGAVRVKDGAPARRERSQTNSHRDSAAKRRKDLLRAQFKAASSPGTPSPEREAPEPEPEPEPTLPPTRVQLVPEADPRVDKALAIPVEHQRLVLAIVDQIGSLSHFDLLGIAPTTEKKEIRRAYHQMSRKFHPDAYYGKELGSFRSLLDQLFKRARASYELLTDDSRRGAYVERLLAEREREQAQLRAQKRGEQDAKDQAKRLEAERVALEQQLRDREQEAQRAEERKARQERDRQRRMRQGRRMSPLEGRQKKAREHYEQGLAELEGKRAGAAYSFFRLAMDLDPGNEEYHQLWQQSLADARIARADKAFDMARQYEEMARVAEAAHYYQEAAEANPTPRYLAHAALSLRLDDAPKAREMALRALDGLMAAQQMGSPLAERDAGNVHTMCGFVFLAAGQVHSAKEQAEAAQAKLGESDNLRNLQNALKAAKA